MTTTPRIADVSDQILNTILEYGASGTTEQNYTAAARSLNFDKGATFQSAERQPVTTIPKVFAFKDTVGLFGAENHFVMMAMNLQNPVSAYYEEAGWEAGGTSVESVDLNDPYTFANEGLGPGQAYINPFVDETVVNTYEPSVIDGATVVRNIESKYFKVELNNVKTGNIYVDNWLDVRLYNQYFDEHPYDVMYVKRREPFYIGFHARNTKRLPYNVECIVGRSQNDVLNDGVLDEALVPDQLRATKL